MNDVLLGGKPVGEGHPCLVIAEAGVNHNGDMVLAHRLVDSAAEARADAVKFQFFFTEELITNKARKAAYQIATTGPDDSQFTMLKKLELSGEQHMELKRHCEARNILYLCTPYDIRSADILESMGVAGYKIASTDVTNLQLLRHVGRKNIPLLLSTGMCDLSEVDFAVRTLEDCGAGDRTILLHCLSEYPAPVDQLNLRAIQTLRGTFGCPTGYSDHTAGIGAGPWAVALGAMVIEKHFTLDRTLPGPDHPASIEPDELSALIREIRNVEAALGDGIKRVMPAEAANKPLMQKSLVAVRDIPAGERISADVLSAKRPATGLAPSWLDRVSGRRARLPISADMPLTLDMIDWSDDGRPGGAS
ncbi:N-acetylneuraminate synthase (plasmid) [Azospirillum sp. TSA2s]|uniref:N-acetylneuraminate synthase n=1 Tax=Azospirillum sp. TSA2s TaxID=709810 RepID=UPI0010AA270E|nr:N-acetylneuraminate synthase [Azospirillum sp. TSA2s]QCG93038.1 N-acetylneuraminate synthase [Azospirillum sp. TSA2s]